MVEGKLIHALDQIELLPGTRIGKKDFSKYIEMFTLFENDQNSIQLYEYLLNVFPAWTKVVSWVKPYTLPTDYLFFQCFYSGLNIVTTNYDFWLNGAGPLVNEAYFPLMGDTAWTEPSRDGLLTLGDMENFSVSEDDECYCTFLLDLAQVFAHQNAIIAVGPMTGTFDVLYEVIKSPTTYKSKWAIVASSFTQWIEKIAASQGNNTDWLPFSWTATTSNDSQ